MSVGEVLISEVSIKNWKSHKDSKFEFSDGVNAIMGIMGSGKSSVMDAICFALFGTYPALNQRKLKLDDLIRNKPTQEQKSELYVKFQAGNDEYSVLRVIERGKGTSKSRLEKNGERIEGPNAQRVTEYVEKVLKINYELFVRAVYSEQNQIDYFLSIPTGKRKDKIDQLLGIDKFEVARKNLYSISSSLLLEAQSKKETASSIFDVIDVDTLTRLETEIQKEETEIEELGKELREAKSLAAEAEKRVQEMEKNQKIASEISSKIERLTGQAEALRKGLKESSQGIPREEIERELEGKHEKIREMADLKESFEKFSLKKAGLSATSDVLRDELNIIGKEIGAAKISISSLEELKSIGIEAFEKTNEEIALKESLEVITQEISNLRDIEKVRESLAENEKLENRLKVETEYARHFLEDIETSDDCPLCKTQMSGKTKESVESEHRAKIIASESEFSLINAEQEKLVKELDILTEKMEKLEHLETTQESIQEGKRSELKILEMYLRKRETVEAEIERADSALAEINTKLENVLEMLEKNGASKIETEIKNLEKTLEAVRREESLTEISKERDPLIEELERLGFSRDAYRSATEEKHGCIISLERLSASVRSLEEILSQKKVQIKSLENKRKLQETQLKDAEKMTELTDALELYKTAIRKTQESLRKEFIIVVNEVMDEIWETLYPYQDITGARLLIENGDYILKVRTSTGWTEVEGKISGGERSVAILALRIAFSLALAPTLSWLILDEPTHNLDTNATDELATALRERLPKLIKQIFLITHEERLESAVTTYLYKLERDKNVDGATVVTMATSPVENGNY